MRTFTRGHTRFSYFAYKYIYETSSHNDSPQNVFHEDCCKDLNISSCNYIKMVLLFVMYEITKIFYFNCAFR